MTARTEGRTMHSPPHQHGHTTHQARSVCLPRAAVPELLTPLLALGRTETMPPRGALGKGAHHDVLAPLGHPPIAHVPIDGFAVYCLAVPAIGS